MGVTVHAQEGKKSLLDIPSAMAVAEEKGISGQLSLTSLDLDNGTFSLCVNNLQGDEVQYLDIAIWSEENGQDDILWKKAYKNNNTYMVEDSVSEHNFSFGKYFVHVYAVSKDGSYAWIDSMELDFPIKISTPTVQEISGENSYEITIQDISLPGGIQEVEFAIWSKINGQDDIHWYKTQKNNTGYLLNWNLKNHKGLGEYEVHAYAKTMSGVSVCVGKSSFEISESKIGSIAVNEIDESKGTFKVELGDVYNGSFISSAQIAVWSNVNGQDDIRWYDFSFLKNSKNALTVNIKNHKYSLGSYNIHVYYTDITGMQHFAGSTTCALEAKLGNMQISEGENAKFLVHIEGCSVPGGIKRIEIPVWSSVNGQDDLRWYVAQKTSNNSYDIEFDIRDHRGTGFYNVQSYIVTNGGEYIFGINSGVSVNAPSAADIRIENYDLDNGSFSVVISGISNEEIMKKILVPVWSEEKGQDDLCWYVADKKKDGQYRIDVDIKDHQYSLGKYNIHVYIRDVTNCDYFSKMLQTEFNIQPGNLSVVEKSEKDYIIELSDFIVPGGIKQIQFPVWSKENGQDDIKWHVANKTSDGSYKYKMSLTEHKGLGDYLVHSYAKLQNGNLVYLGNNEFKTEEPSINSITTEITDYKAGIFQVKISGIKNEELIKKIMVPVWSDKSQKDIVWYEASPNSDGECVVNVNINKHKFNCNIYNIHVYLKDITEEETLVDTLKCDMRPTYHRLVAEDVDGTESSIHITLSGLSVPAGEKSVSFAVWGTENNQNDIKWYSATRDKDGNYVSSVKIRNHKELGRYIVHAYCKNQENADYFLGATTFDIVKISSISAVNVSEIDGTSGTFRVTVTGVIAPSGVNEIKIPVWCAADQSDIVWYEASKLADSTYTVKVSAAKHAHHFGEYKIHVYITMNNGITSLSGTTTTVLQPHNYVYNMRISDTQREVGIIGASAERVQFPTWSVASGQDDIIWYEGENRGGGKWNAVVDSAKHNSGGEYMTHVYATSSGSVSQVGSTSYSLSWKPNDQQQMILRSNLYSSSTPFLILVNRTTHKVGIFQGWTGNWRLLQYWDCSDGKASTPTVEGIFKVGSRGYYFYSGDAICYWWTQFYGDYLFHSVLYNRYNGSLMDGRLGMGLSHGCVRMDINNAKWIYDTIPSGSTVVVYH